ncbi:MAG: ATP-binding protein, partial [Planctomycetales bacterium]
MYESYWNLQRRPFESVSDSDFYFPAESHQGALLKLRYAVENRKGAALLAGDHGAGKTFLADVLSRETSEAFRPFVHMVFPCMPAADLLAYLADELAAPRPDGPASVEQSVRRIQQALSENTRQGRHAVICMDEAHLLEDPECWDALRLLCNFQSDGAPDFT